MIQKIIKLAATGFIIGMAVGNLIAIITSYAGGGEILIFSDALLAKAGNAANALAIQTFFSGLLGSVSMGSVIFYDMDDWSMTRVVITHFFVIFAVYLLIAPNLGWISSSTEIVIMFLVMAVAYFIIWVIMYLRYQAMVRQLNDLIDSNRE